MTDKDIPLPAPTAEEMERAMADGLLYQEADRQAVLIGLAARRHPELVTKALASVFDLSGLERANRNAAADSAEVARVAWEARLLLDDINRELGRIEKRIDGLEEWLERAAQRAKAFDRHYRRAVESVVKPQAANGQAVRK